MKRLLLSFVLVFALAFGGFTASFGHGPSLAAPVARADGFDDFGGGDFPMPSGPSFDPSFFWQWVGATVVGGVAIVLGSVDFFPGTPPATDAPCCGGGGGFSW